MSEPSRPPFKAPVGTRDVLPPESARWEELISRYATLVERAGYGLLQTPMFEDIEVFSRVGEGTDIVGKEMYDFEDKGGRRIALRPEGTASAVRAYVQHRPVPPWKVWYVAPNFRHEKPQAGRYRQHHQLGLEAIGPDDPDLDVEVIALAWDLYRELGLRRVDLLVNSMGDPEGRQHFLDDLVAYLADHRGDLAPEDRAKVADHPLRVLDSKRKATIEVTREAPRLVDQLSDEAGTHFERVQEGLRTLRIPFTIEPRLVRGLDYYTRTTFEFQASALDAAQNAIGGGGRYDGLVEALGGPPTAGIGFAVGIERMLLACDAEDVFPVPERPLAAFVVDVTGGEVARDLTAELRRAGVAADRSFGGRSMKAQMKAADRSGALYALIVGEEEARDGTVSIRDLRGDGTQTVVERGDVARWLQKEAGS